MKYISVITFRGGIWVYIKTVKISILACRYVSCVEDCGHSNCQMSFLSTIAQYH